MVKKNNFKFPPKETQISTKNKKNENVKIKSKKAKSASVLITWKVKNYNEGQTSFWVYENDKQGKAMYLYLRFLAVACEDQVVTRPMN